MITFGIVLYDTLKHYHIYVDMRLIIVVSSMQIFCFVSIYTVPNTSIPFLLFSATHYLVRLEVLDSNDEPPVFLNQPRPFLSTVRRDSPPGSVVYTLNASDPDTGSSLRFYKNGRVYSFFFLQFDKKHYPYCTLIKKINNVNTD